MALILRELEEEYATLLREFILGKEAEVKRSLDLFHRGRVEVKALTDSNMLVNLTAILSPLALYAAIKVLVGQVITKAVESVEVDLNVNLPDFNPVFRERAANHNFELVKGMTDDLAENLRETLLEGWQNGEGIAQLKKRVGTVWDNGNLTSARAESIARTETNRLFNESRLQVGKDSGISLLKVWDAHHDSRTGSDSKALEKRYLHNPILLDSDFYDEVNDQYINSPPNRPNCRCRVGLVRGGEVVSSED